MIKTKTKPAEQNAAPALPAELSEALAADAKAEAQWNDLTPIARGIF